MQGLTGNRLRKGGDRVRDLIQAASGRLACLALAAIMVLETVTGKVCTPTFITLNVLHGLFHLFMIAFVFLSQARYAGMHPC